MDKVLIIDFGSQVTKLIAKKIRKINVFSEIKSHNITLDEFKQGDYKCVILSGSPDSVLREGRVGLAFHIQDFGVPVLGICYGMQLMINDLGGEVAQSHAHEYGRTVLNVRNESLLLSGICDVGDNTTVWMSHGDTVKALPIGFKHIAETEGGNLAIVENAEERLYALQFHPEVEHTDRGLDILENFVVRIAECKQAWKSDLMLQEAQNYIRSTFQQGKILCAVSGGVDSTVLAVLLSQTLYDKDSLKAIFVNHGLLRKNEEEEVKGIFQKLGAELQVVDAQDIFLDRLKGVENPEEKRKIIGRTFIEVFEAQIKGEDYQYLAQGTLYPDVIESVSTTGNSVTIKSHHNVGGLPEKMGLKLIEPFRNYFKDEVREIGKILSIPNDFIGRHPFPGPGLAVRILGGVTKEKCDILREADDIYIRLLKEHNLYNEIWQAFAVLLPTKTVGVMGDARTYDYTCALRAITSVDGMTGDVYEFKMDFLKMVSTQIVNKVNGINRVVYDITSKPPATIEWE